jgi:hypothetical protein
MVVIFIRLVYHDASLVGLELEVADAVLLDALHHIGKHRLDEVCPSIAIVAILGTQALRVAALEQHNIKQDYEIEELKKQVSFFVRTSLPPIEGVFYDGQIFDAYMQITNLIKQAKRSIVLVDNYIDESTLLMLSKRGAGVTATIYTRQLTSQQQLDLTRHNSQYPPINVMVCRHNHDRFLIIDDVPYLFGASIKDAGKKLFAFIKMQETAAADILNFIR